MTLQNLKYMIEISNCGSFSQAAKKLFISQSTLSTAVKEVEQDLGITLFHRTNRGVSLTLDGEDFIRYAKDIVDRTRYLEQRYASRKSLPIRFSISAQHLPFVVRSFTSFLNDLDLSSFDMALRECDTLSVLNEVYSGRSELGIVALQNSQLNTFQTQLTAMDMNFHEIAQLQNYVFLRKEHPLASKDLISIKDLEDYPFVTYDDETEISPLSEELLIYTILNKNMHVSDRCTKIALVRKTDCFSIGPDLTNSNADSFHKGTGEIIARPLNEDIGQLHLGYIHKNNYILSSLAQKYFTYLTEELNSLLKIC
ncbi:MAG: LysR family transcriptional regulator [Blautia sp.]|nr:LysR family transcriptional regulator [Blautia sp.]MDY3999957.1 LysR family transcriptional regulator [Blautia sp.]